MEYYDIIKSFKINNISISGGMNKSKHKLSDLEYKFSNLLNIDLKKFVKFLLKKKKMVQK